MQSRRRGPRGGPPIRVVIRQGPSRWMVARGVGGLQRGRRIVEIYGPESSG